MKSFASYRRWLRKSQVLSKNAEILTRMVEKGLRGFYFLSMKKKYIRELRRRYLKKVAKNYFVEQRKFKAYKAWSTVVKKIVKELGEAY